MDGANATKSGKVIVTASRLFLVALVSIVLLYFLAPWPGLGMIYSITDPLRGHPDSRHGTQPSKFVGLWVQEEPGDFTLDAWAFYLMDDSTVARGPSISKVRWHFDKNRLFIDYVSRCGNCYRGVETSEYTVKFDGRDRMELTPIRVHGTYGVIGWFKRVVVDDELRKAQQSYDDSDFSPKALQARSILRVIEQYEGYEKGYDGASDS